MTDLHLPCRKVLLLVTGPYLAHARILGKDVYPPKHVMDATRERASTGW